MSRGRPVQVEARNREDALVLGHIARYPGLTAHAIARALRFAYPPDYTGGQEKTLASLGRLQAARLVTWDTGLADGRERKLWRLAGGR